MDIVHIWITRARAGFVQRGQDGDRGRERGADRYGVEEPLRHGENVSNPE